MILHIGILSESFDPVVCMWYILFYFKILNNDIANACMNDKGGWHGAERHRCPCAEPGQVTGTRDEALSAPWKAE